MNAPSEHLVYDMGVEALFRGLGERVTPELKAEVWALGIDLDKKLLPGYPKAVWVRVVDAVAQALSRDSPLSEARKALGFAITHGFADTTLGRMLAPGFRLMGVRRMLLRLPRTLTISNNFLKVAVTETGARSMRVELNEAVPSEEFLAGVIEAMAAYAGAKQTEVRFAVEGPLTVFTVAWSE